MDRLERMEVFARVAELASFTQAADSLGLPKASVSEAVKQLESWLGTRLFNRTTRRVHLTPDGEVFYERCRDLLADVEDATTLFRRAETVLTGRVRVDMPTGTACRLVLPHLSDFKQRYPGIDVELSTTDYRVDLVRDGFDCVLRVGPLSNSNLIARPLGRLPVASCASPAYLAQYRTPESLDDLAEHKLIHYTQTLGSGEPGWEYWDGRESRNIPMEAALTVNGTEAYLHACLSGLGIIQVPKLGIQDYLERGELVEIMPGYPAEPMTMSLLYPHRRAMARRVRVFMDWLAELMA
ncbi:MAG: LysR family transcriptional regulator [Saccharospirillum sp.]|uniref:LysR family transcriptional regulator n=1 Tax=Saccharospirillum sp. TaxID=2033801 RepID=UPI0032985E99